MGAEKMPDEKHTKACSLKGDLKGNRGPAAEPYSKKKPVQQSNVHRDRNGKNNPARQNALKHENDGARMVDNKRSKSLQSFASDMVSNQ